MGRCSKYPLLLCFGYWFLFVMYHLWCVTFPCKVSVVCRAALNVRCVYQCCLSSCGLPCVVYCATCSGEIDHNCVVVLCLSKYVSQFIVYLWLQSHRCGDLFSGVLEWRACCLPHRAASTTRVRTRLAEPMKGGYGLLFSLLDSPPSPGFPWAWKVCRKWTAISKALMALKSVEIIN